MHNGKYNCYITKMEKYIYLFLFHKTTFKAETYLKIWQKDVVLHRTRGDIEKLLFSN